MMLRGNLLVAILAIVVAVLVSEGIATRYKAVKKVRVRVFKPCVKLCRKEGLGKKKCKSICALKQGYTCGGPCWNSCIRTEDAPPTFVLEFCMNKCASGSSPPPSPPPPPTTRVCRWSAWSVTQQGTCSVTCGTGTRTETQTRTKLYSVSNAGNPECFGSTINQRVVSCTNPQFPVCPQPPPQRRVCRWSAWSVTQQGTCSVTCGTGTRTETQIRSKLFSFSNAGNPECFGSTINQRVVSCTNPQFPVCPQPPPQRLVCNWSVWGTWVYGTCVSNRLPWAPSCPIPGTVACHRTRQCICRGKRTPGAIPQNCIGASIERKSRSCCVGLPPPPTTLPTTPPPACRLGAWTPWVYGTCVRNTLPPTLTCLAPGTTPCQRTRQCVCFGKRTIGAIPQSCIGATIERKSQPCCNAAQPTTPTPTPACRLGAWTPWVYGTCVRNTLPPTLTCLAPGTTPCQRTRQCVCFGKRTIGTIQQSCIGATIERKSQPCCNAAQPTTPTPTPGRETL
ncbi:unnamed protein product [Owenia fusiformis]|uniref:Uncharacterized protein n=1 Tax=Owenia fusiformis TaxID=6347 RepID=A0A8J1Y0X4_OWEFU|nr:unnamed protein product [Owenia fusiformis]